MGRLRVAGSLRAARACAAEEDTATVRMRPVTLAELADEAGVEEPIVQQLIDLGEIRPLSDGRYDARDGIIVGTVRPCSRPGSRSKTSCGRSRRADSVSVSSGDCSPILRRGSGRTPTSRARWVRWLTG